MLINRTMRIQLSVSIIGTDEKGDHQSMIDRVLDLLTPHPDSVLVTNHNEKVTVIVSDYELTS